MTQQSWVREPVLHFAILGALIFGIDAALSPSGGIELRVPDATRAALISDFERRTGKAPGTAETGVLVDHWIDEELLFREGRRLGLERGDPIVRRRVIQRMKALQRTMYPVEIPSDASLEAWLRAQGDRYELPPRAAFEHVFASGRHRDPKVRAEAHRVALNTGADPTKMGDPFPHARSAGLTELQSIERTYGPPFAEVVSRASVGKWNLAPSEFGWHVVRVLERESGGTAALDDVREVVEQDWMAEQERLVEEEALRGLREKAGL